MSALADQQTTGMVFNVQKYSLHDGPGIRTVVFLKGCPLSCPWCCNPESQARAPELAHNPGKCITLTECGRCLDRCEQGAISCGQQDKALLCRDHCGGCTFACADVCPAKALIVYGSERSVADVLQTVEKDSLFYARSGGGMTLSGGEPLIQPAFVLALLREAKRRRIKRVVETCGFCDWEVLHEVGQHLNLLIYDLKCIDSAKHKKFTKVSNEKILSNFNQLCAAYPQLPLLVRTPIIPGFNDTVEDVEAILEFIAHKPNVTYELLPYHRTAQPKYGYLDREYPLEDARLDPEKMAALQALVAQKTERDNDL